VSLRPHRDDGKENELPGYFGWPSSGPSRDEVSLKTRSAQLQGHVDWVAWSSETARHSPDGSPSSKPRARQTLNHTWCSNYGTGGAAGSLLWPPVPSQSSCRDCVVSDAPSSHRRQTKQHSPQRSRHQVSQVSSRLELSSVRSKVQELRGLAGRRRIVCVSGGTCHTHPDTTELVRALAASMRRSILHNTLLVTCGMEGVQRAFAEHCADGPSLWNLVPVGESSGFGAGEDVPVGRHFEETSDIFARLGEVYVVVEGGPSVSEQAMTSIASGALVLPVARSGGASSGMFNFPTAALKRPVHATFEQWRLLWDVSAPVESTAAAVSAIVATALRDGACNTANSKREDRMQRLLASWASVAQDAIFPSSHVGSGVQRPASPSVAPEVSVLSEGTRVRAIPVAEQHDPSGRAQELMMERHRHAPGDDTRRSDCDTATSLDVQGPATQELEEAMLEVRKSLARMQQATRCAAEALAEHGFSSGFLSACPASPQRAGSCPACGLEASGPPSLAR